MHIVAPKSETDKWVFEQMGCYVHPWDLHRRSLNPLREWQALRQLVRLYRHVKPDLTHHVSIKPVIYGGIAAAVTHIRCKVHAITGLGASYISETLRARLIRWLLQYGFKFISRQARTTFIFQNRDDQTLFIANKFIRREQARIIYGAGVCMRAYHPLPLPKGESGVVVLASRLLVDKGVIEFVQAAQQLRSKINVRCVLVGEVDPGNPASLTAQQINVWVTAGFVEWWGHQEDMNAVFRKCHVVCLPSYREGSPRVLIEAAAVGRPIITTDVPGCRDLVLEGVNGYLVPVKNACALAKAIEKIFEGHPPLAIMGQKSRELVELKYAETKVVSDTFDIYQELLMEEECKIFNER